MRLRGGHETSDPRLDRLPEYDDRSTDFPIRGLLGVERPPRSRTWPYVQLDQGREGACTGFSATMEAAAWPAPVFGDPRTKRPDPGPINAVARDVYRRARQLDDWPGENYEGSSVLGAVKAGVERGWWGEYRWALGPGPDAAAADVIAAIGYSGPVMMGSYWWSGMMRPDEQGRLRRTGRREGGHAYLLTRYSRKLDAVWTPNSWGGEGQGWISRSDLAALLGDDGEACIAVVRLRPRPER